jgi:hypothetical protein
VVILVDSSAWIEFLRGTGTTVNEAVRRLMTDRSDPIVTTEVVHMELLAGAVTPRESKNLRQLLARFELVPLEGLADFDHAAAIYRTCRRQGHTVRTRLDCLIAAVAIRTDAEVLHNDRDFDTIARHTPLRLAS